MKAPVYMVSWFSGYNEDTSEAVAMVFLKDNNTYVYAFETSADNFESMKEMYTQQFNELKLEAVSLQR